jgi:hypothetical protein
MFLRRVVEATAIGLAVFALLWAGQTGCKKTNSPFGVNAPNGVDVPTGTPTPVSGSIEVYVKDAGIAIQGVSVVVVDPTGNTLGPMTTQAAPYGSASFNPPNLINGVWTAEILTQSVSYFSSPLTINHYYYQSAQPFTVAGPGTYSVLFYNEPGTIVASPTSITYGSAYPEFLPVTYTYNNVGNINVPISVVCPAFPVNGINSIPSQFIFGEGVSVQAVTIYKNACFSFDYPYTTSASDFTNDSITSSPTTFYHSYPVSISLYYYLGGSCSGYEPCTKSYTNCYNFGISTTNDCGLTWNYEVDNGCGVVGTGTMVSGPSGEVSYPFNPGDAFGFTVWTPYIRVNFSNITRILNTSSPVTLLSAVYSN